MVSVNSVSYTHLAIFIGFMTAALTTLELTTDVIGILLGLSLIHI